MKYEEIRIRLFCIYGLQVASSRRRDVNNGDGGRGSGRRGKSSGSGGSLLWKMALDVLLSDHLALSEILERFQDSVLASCFHGTLLPSEFPS